MIAVIEKPDRFCIVRWIGQQSIIKVIAVSWCNEQSNAGDGVQQLPDKTINAMVPGISDGRPRPVCTRCKQALGI